MSSSALGRHDGTGVITVANVAVECVSWLWPGWFPMGKLVALIGDPAVGKSTIATTVAAVVSSGGRWPTGELCAAADVIYLSAEDGVADTLRPRLEAAGADLRRVHVITHVQDETEGPQRPISIPEDVDRLEHEAHGRSVKLIVVDVLNSFLSGKTDSHKDASLRGALAPLAGMADRLGAVVLYLLHLNKSGGTQAMYRAAGSVAYVAAARVALIAAHHPDSDQADAGTRVVAQVKNNLAPIAGAVGYRLVSAPPPLDCAAIEWSTGSIGLSADDLLRSITAEEADDRKEVDRALESLFQTSTFVKAGEALKQLGAAGFERNSVLRARKRLGITSDKDGMSGGWLWRWPHEESAQLPQGAQPFPIDCTLSPFPETGTDATDGASMASPVFEGSSDSRPPPAPAVDKRTFEEMASSYCDTCGSSTVRQRVDGLWRHAKCEPTNPNPTTKENQ